MCPPTKNWPLKNLNMYKIFLFLCTVRTRFEKNMSKAQAKKTLLICLKDNNFQTPLQQDKENAVPNMQLLCTQADEEKQEVLLDIWQTFIFETYHTWNKVFLFLVLTKCKSFAWTKFPAHPLEKRKWNVNIGIASWSIDISQPTKSQNPNFVCSLFTINITAFSSRENQNRNVVKRFCVN